MVDSDEFSLHIRGGGHIAVRQMAEIQLDARLQAPIERYLVYGYGAASAIHGRCEMIRGIQMSAVVGDEIDPLDSPRFAIRQVLRSQSGEKLLDLRKRFLVIDVLNVRSVAGRIRQDIIFQENRQVYDSAWH